MKSKCPPRGADPLRLNLFFDLLLFMSKARDFDSLSATLGTHLRLIIDFDESYFIVGNPDQPSLQKIYISTLASPRIFTTPQEDETTIEICKNGFKANSEGNKLCFLLVSHKTILGSMMLFRKTHFNYSEIRFAESISGFLTQMLANFAAHDKLQKSEDQLNLLNQKLKEESALRENFVAALSHDLRTPMAAASMAAQILRKNSTNSEMVNAKSLSIVASVDRADRMISNLLDSNHIHAGGGIPISIESCRLDLIIAKTVRDLNEVHQHRFQVKNRCGEIDGFWDPHSIQRMVENLANNAIKYGSPKAPITIHLLKDHECVEINVHNEGAVISTKDQKILFGQYSRTKSAIVSGQRGWGIGLTLVKGLAEAHHGTIRVESTKELGTTFFLKLPLDASPFRT